MNIVKVYPDGSRSRSMTVESMEAAQSGLDQLASNYTVVERGSDYVIVENERGQFRFEVEA